MADEVETAGTESPTSNTATATTPAPNTEALIAAAKEEARREAQAAKDREIARLHQEHQAREKQLLAQARDTLKGAGVENADEWEELISLRQKAAKFDAVEQQASAWQQWQSYVNETAAAYGLKAEDPRLANADSAEDLLKKAKTAMAEDAKQERAQMLAEADGKQRAELDKKIQSGEQDVLGGAPAGSVGLDLSKVTDSRELYRLASQKAVKEGHGPVRAK